MIDPEMGLLGFRIAIFILLVSTWLLFITEPGSAAFFVDVIAFIVSIIFLVLLAVLIRHRRK